MTAIAALSEDEAQRRTDRLPGRPDVFRCVKSTAPDGTVVEFLADGPQRVFRRYERIDRSGATRGTAN